MHSALRHLDHRPWPLPAGRWFMRQSWCDLLFAHVRVPVATLRPLIPAQLQLQQFDGSAWIGVVPFRMQGVMFRPLPDLPRISAFPELNVRTYVELDGKPGVWFFSLDASNALAVWTARTFFNLPYFLAAMSLRPDSNGVHYESTRRGSEPASTFRASYRPSSEVYVARPGTLEHFLTERYCLYAHSPAGQLFRTEIHHRPWPLQRAEADIEQCTLLQFLPEPQRANLAEAELLHFTRRIDVIVWRPELAVN